MFRKANIKIWEVTYNYGRLVKWGSEFKPTFGETKTEQVIARSAVDAVNKLCIKKGQIETYGATGEETTYKYEEPYPTKIELIASAYLEGYNP